MMRAFCLCSRWAAQWWFLVTLTGVTFYALLCVAEYLFGIL